MTSFALITEGITDQITLQTILLEFYAIDLDINPLQPVRDSTDASRKGHFGGWEQVLEYCSLPDFKNTLLFNEYVVIQLDTDCAEHVNFGVPLTSDGLDKSPVDIIREVKSVLINKIGTDIYNEYKEQIIFAISVHSLECWYLPLYGKLKAKKSKIKKCADELCKELTKQNITYKKEYEVYKVLSKEFKAKNAIEQCTKYNQSFNHFIKSLPEIN